MLGHAVPWQPAPGAVSSKPTTSNCAADAGAATTSIAATRARNVLVQRIITSLLHPSLTGARAPAPNVRPGSAPRLGQIRLRGAEHDRPVADVVAHGDDSQRDSR